MLRNKSTGLPINLVELFQIAEQWRYLRQIGKLHERENFGFFLVANFWTGKITKKAEELIQEMDEVKALNLALRLIAEPV